MSGLPVVQVLVHQRPALLYVMLITVPSLTLPDSSTISHSESYYLEWKETVAVS